MIDKHTAKHYTWGDNCQSWVLADTPELSVKEEMMPPGAKEQLHYHNRVQQFFFILKGTATFYCNEKKNTVNTQQGITIAPKTKHYIANETNAELEFLIISQPSTNRDRININTDMII
jgi:mannose-6-phosphate isomerase-like protein (cupin superfamily)